jgi:hypothetical protein
MFTADPTTEVLKNIGALQRAPVPLISDEKELAERTEAAGAYAGEKPGHFVDYVADCVRQSVDAMRKIRRQQQECWRVFNEEEPEFYGRKEEWQSKVVLPKPYSAVLFAAAVARKGFDTDFLSIKNEQNKLAARFWEMAMPFFLSKTQADFPLTFMDASQMSFAIGTSMETLPVWRAGGLRLINVEPWKIHRDPDSATRKPQSGLFWVHQEYQDLWLVKEYGKDKRYINTDKISGPGSATNPLDPNLNQAEIDKRKGMLWHRSGFRDSVLTSEFWGTVLSSNGEMLLPSATYTICADQVVRLPKPSPYPTLRWPGMSFSVLPHLLRYDGRGLIHGIKSLWNFMNGLMCLHNDSLNWTVNPTSEIDTSSLVDPQDVDDWPGKKYLTRGTQSGQQVVRYHDRRSTTSDILANMNFCDQRFQEGTFVTNLVQGLPGYRAEVTAREAAQSLEQALTIFGLIGKNLEAGALDIITACCEVIRVNLTYQQCQAWFGIDEQTSYYWADYFYDPAKKTRLNIPGITTGAFHVSGLTNLMKEWEQLRSIRDIIIPLAENDSFKPFMNKYGILRAVEARLGLQDEKILIPIQQAIPIEAAIAQQFASEIEAAIQLNQAEAEQATREALSTPVAPPLPELPPPPGNEGAQ